MKKRDKVMLQSLSKKVKKYFIGKAAMNVVGMIQADCISDTTRYLISKDGYDNAYTALAHQYIYGYKESSNAIVTDIRFVVKTQFAMLPDFVHTLMEYECPNPEENRLHFCRNVYEKAVALISSDVDTAKREEERQIALAEIPF